MICESLYIYIYIYRYSIIYMHATYMLKLRKYTTYIRFSLLFFFKYNNEASIIHIRKEKLKFFSNKYKVIEKNIMKRKR